MKCSHVSFPCIFLDSVSPWWLLFTPPNATGGLSFKKLPYHYSIKLLQYRFFKKKVEKPSGEGVCVSVQGPRPSAL